jgi:hypothetical protein
LKRGGFTQFATRKIRAMNNLDRPVWASLTYAPHLLATRPIAPQAGAHTIIELGGADVPEMVALAHLTEVGPFLPRTHTIGHFISFMHGRPTMRQSLYKRAWASSSGPQFRSPY